MLESPLLSRAIIFDEALISSVIRYGEADAIVRLFSRTKGRMGVFFKNGFASTKQRIGAIQAPSLAKVAIAESRTGLARLKSCDIDPQCFQISSSLKTFAFSSYLAELIERMIPEEEPAPEFFDVLKETWFELGAKGPESYILRYFELRMLDYCGYMPEWPKSDSPLVSYDPQSGRFVEPNEEHCVIKLSTTAISVARSMLHLPITSMHSVGQEELMMLARIFNSRLRILGITELKSIKFLKSLRAIN